MDSRRFASRLSADVVGRILTVGASGLTVVLAARVLEPDGYGLLTLAITVFSIAGMVGEMGISKATARYVTTYLEEDTSQLPHLVRKAGRILVASLLVATLAITLGHELVADLVGEPDLAALLLYGSVYLLFSGLSKFPRRILQAFQDIQLAAFLRALQGVTKLIFVAVLVIGGFGVIGALAGYILSFVIATCVGFGILIVRYYGQFQPAKHAEDGLGKRIASYSVPIFFTKGSDSIIKRVDILLIGYFVNPVAVGYYNVAKQVAQFAQLPASALGFTVSPAYGKFESSEQRAEASRMFEKTLVYTLLLYLPAVAGLILVAEPTVEYVFGPDYLGAVQVLQLFAVFMLLQALTKITSGGLDFIGRARTRAIVKGVSSIANLGLNLVLIPRFGIEGAAAATVATYGFYALANVYVMAVEFPVRSVYLAKKCGTIVLITTGMGAAVALTGGFVSGLPSLLGVILFGVVVWAILSLGTGMIETDDVQSMIG